jgi:hypothetical protein
MTRLVRKRRGREGGILGCSRRGCIYQRLRGGGGGIHLDRELHKLGREGDWEEGLIGL